MFSFSFCIASLAVFGMLACDWYVCTGSVNIVAARNALAIQLLCCTKSQEFVRDLLPFGSWCTADARLVRFASDVVACAVLNFASLIVCCDFKVLCVAWWVCFHGDIIACSFDCADFCVIGLLFVCVCVSYECFCFDVPGCLGSLIVSAVFQ